jgi:hypothetical protein
VRFRFMLDISVPVGAIHPGSLPLVGCWFFRGRAVLEVLDGAVISAVARRSGVSRQTVHAWLRLTRGRTGQCR